MPDSKALVAALAALAAASLVHGEQTGQPLEDMKRELRSLPGVESKLTPDRKTSIEKPSLPGLVVPSTPAPGPASETSGEAAVRAARSANWLLDGVANLEKETQAQQRVSGRETKKTAGGDRSAWGKKYDANGGGGRLSDGSATDGAELGAKNSPLSSYLSQWLSPRDLAALRQSESSNAIGGGSHALARPEANGGLPSVAANAPAMFSAEATLPSTSSPTLFPGAESRRSNPYLDDVADLKFSSSATSAGQSSATTSPSAFVLTLPPSTTSLSKPVTDLRSSAQPPKEVRPAPTERIVDDRKYFPQLRRF